MQLKFEKRAKKIINLGWGHGIYGDLWSLVHVNTGILLGIITLFFALPFYHTALFILIVLFLYEVFEMQHSAIEDFENSTTDIVIAFMGFIFSYSLFQYLEASSTLLITVFVVIAVLSVVLDYIGWEKYLKAHTNSVSKHQYTSIDLRPSILILSLLLVILFAIMPLFA